MTYLSHAFVAVVAFVAGAYLVYQPAFDAGKVDGEDSTVVYCNLSRDFCKLQLDRMAERSDQPRLYKTMFGKAD